MASNFFKLVANFSLTSSCSGAVLNDQQMSDAAMSNLTAVLCLLKPPASM